MKITICIREDILMKITDPDINKIKRDSSLLIDWSKDTQGLKKVVDLRFEFSGIQNNFDLNENYWYKIFPKKIRNKDSWEHILNYTLYKPRDVLQFLKSCQELYPNKESLGFKEVNDAIKAYSKDYFIEEMKNEVSGFVSENLITLLPTIFQRLGSNRFSLGEFKRNFEMQSTTKIQNENEVKLLLALLFEAGYIGQLIENKTKRNRQTSSVIFKYRNPGSQVDYSQKFIIHMGIQEGLGIKLQ
ncbi:P-loop ATPase, Sll1717 family [Companilactobacillus sp. DQM5]|uniref:P-loop ATPase, Sll1717 family n=1 Tax=Companilactobacillus sp. DQM5 TaxID=3463359 RepID=UPI00405A3609